MRVEDTQVQLTVVFKIGDYLEFRDMVQNDLTGRFLEFQTCDLPAEVASAPHLGAVGIRFRPRG